MAIDVDALGVGNEHEKEDEEEEAIWDATVCAIDSGVATPMIDLTSSSSRREHNENSNNSTNMNDSSGNSCGGGSRTKRYSFNERDSVFVHVEGEDDDNDDASEPLVPSSGGRVHGNREGDDHGVLDLLSPTAAVDSDVGHRLLGGKRGGGEQTAGETVWIDQSTGIALDDSDNDDSTDGGESNDGSVGLDDSLSPASKDGLKNDAKQQEVTGTWGEGREGDDVAGEQQCFRRQRLVNVADDDNDENDDDGVIDVSFDYTAHAGSPPLQRRPEMATTFTTGTSNNTDENNRHGHYDHADDGSADDNVDDDTVSSRHSGRHQSRSSLASTQNSTSTMPYADTDDVDGLACDDLSGSPTVETEFTDDDKASAAGYSSPLVTGEENRVSPLVTY